MKILFTADLQLGDYPLGKIDIAHDVHERFWDFFKSLDYMVDYAIENKIKIFVIGGDIFKYRNPDSLSRKEFARRLDKLQINGIMVIIVLGNHDLSTVANSLEPLSTLSLLRKSNLHIIEKFEGLNVRYPGTLNCFIDFCCYSYPGKGENRLTNFKNIMQSWNQAESKYKIFVGHFSVKGAKFGKTQMGIKKDKFIIDRNIFEKGNYKAVFLGHIHKHQFIDRNIVYAGSIERVDFNEVKDPKSFIVYDFIKDKFETIYLKTRTMILFKIDKLICDLILAYSDRPIFKSRFDMTYQPIIVQLKKCINNAIVKIEIESEKYSKYKVEYDKFIDTIKSYNPFDLKIKHSFNNDENMEKKI